MTLSQNVNELATRIATEINSVRDELASAPGIPGPQGETGPAGIPGPKGDKGDAGNDGAPGAPGAPGNDGAPGATGPAPFTIVGEYNNGADYGYGAAVYYQGGTYVRTGNPLNPGYPPTPGAVNGSWTPIADKGEAGAPGNDGAQGLKGDTGSAGAQGAPGAQGPKGDTGATGAAGPGYPAQVSNAGKLLGTNGTTPSWTSTIASPNFENGIKPSIGITLGSGTRGFSIYDGNSLSTEVSAQNIYFKGIQKAGNVWIGAKFDWGGFYPHSSTDGITWNNLGFAGNGNPFTNYSNNKVAYNGNCFIVVGGNYGGTAGIFKITNITDYAQITNPPTFSSLNWIADTTVTSYNGFFLVPDYTGSSLFYSTDGDNWNTATLPTAAQWTSTIYGAGKYVVVARDSQTAAYATIPSGPWTSITMPDNGYQSLIHDGSKFIAMGAGTLATSTDGVTWTSHSFTEYGTWNMAYSTGSYVATNIDSYVNYILTSTDGITWTQYFTPDAAYGHRSIGLVTTQPASGTLSIIGNSGASGQSLISTGAGIKWGSPASATPTVAGTVEGQVDTLNTALGKNALDTSILQNTNNIGVGQGALRYCTTGGGNVIASHAGTYITTGSGNVGVGDGTLYGMQTGNNNTAIGNYAASGASGSDCTAVGYYAGNRGGTGNSSFGAMAGMYTEGTNNTFLGTNAGKVPNTYYGFTNQNVTVIGANAFQSSKDVSNEITLGSSAVTTIRAAVTSITSLSDERDKTAIEPLTVGLDFVNELKPVQFEWNMRDGGKVGQLDAGFIAQDLVDAEDATGLADYLQLTMRENPEKLEATQGRLIPVLVKAIQELSAEVKALKEGN